MRRSHVVTSKNELSMADAYKTNTFSHVKQMPRHKNYYCLGSSKGFDTFRPVELH